MEAEKSELKIGDNLIDNNTGLSYEVILIDGAQMVIKSVHGLLCVHDIGAFRFEKVKPFVIGKFGSRIREGDKIIFYPNITGIATKIRLAENRVCCGISDGSYDYNAQYFALWSEAFIGKEELIRFGTLCYIDGEEFIADKHKEDIGATFAILLHSVNCNSKKVAIIAGGEDIITMESYQKRQQQQPKEYLIERLKDGGLMALTTASDSKNESIARLSYIQLPSELFPELTCENSPKKLKLE